MATPRPDILAGLDAGTTGLKGTKAGLSTFNPWLMGAGVAADVVGAGLSAYEQAQERKRQAAFEKEQFDWKKKMDMQSQFNTERQLGQNTIQGMRSSFKNNLYTALTRG